MVGVARIRALFRRRPPPGENANSDRSRERYLGYLSVIAATTDSHKPAVVTKDEQPRQPETEPPSPPLSQISTREWDFDERLDTRFKPQKPKRFFSVSRIFKTVWFELCDPKTPVRRANMERTDDFITPFYGKDRRQSFGGLWSPERACITHYASTSHFCHSVRERCHV